MSHTEIEILVALLAGLLSGVVSEIGGAGPLLSLPMLISVGIPPVVANGTNRLGIVTLYTMAYADYQRKHTVDTIYAWRLSFPIIVGTIIGALTATHIADTQMHWVVIGLTVAMILFTSFTKPLTDSHRKVSRAVKWAVLFLAGVYCGLISAGMAFLIFFLMVTVMGMEVEKARGMKEFLSMIVTPFALLIFIWFGHINWLAGGFLAIGAAAGGWYGVELVDKWGDKRTKHKVLISLIISVLYLTIFMIRHYGTGIEFI